MWVSIVFLGPASLIEVIEIKGRRHDEKAIAITIPMVSQLEYVTAATQALKTDLVESLTAAKAVNHLLGEEHEKPNA